tara:strand:+ start:204 stop:548 length:345 start_codon:yes stop_codon:yes gene_type:complete
MAVRIGTEPCKRSKKNRPCIYKLKKIHNMGEGIRKKIEGCARCGEMVISEENIANLECPASYNGKHQWQRIRNISFRQMNRYQKISDEECCKDCGAKQIRDYQLEIPYNPHKRK